MANNVTPFHHRKSQHWHLRRPRNLLRSQYKMSQNRYQNQTRMAPSKKNDNLSYE
jgi:hypothetical protein